ncbi:MAG TPA: M56 family metallopeptidase [Pedobacter sp.]|nr:M56 family metallopeptidase [Pedobacter sp.]
MEFSRQIVNAIGNTLFHSLWQGLALATVTGLIIILTRSQKPALRYNLLIIAMLAFFITTIFTFINAISFSSSVKLAIPLTTKLAITTTNSVNTTFLSQITDYLSNNNGTLVLIWFLIICSRSVQLTIGLIGLRHLRAKAIFGLNSVWQSRVSDLAQQLGIKQAIGFAESNLIKVPMVIGHLKPLILLPIGLLTALPPKEIEAILIHELAHIYRRDYLVNILQSLLEILFFFNPAVLWLSALIKAERENCCDDIAVGLTSSKINYINALVSCQEYQLALPAFAMTFSKKGQLKSRVNRLLRNTNQSLNGIEKSVLTLCIVIASVCLLAFTSETKIEKVVKRTAKTIQSVITTTQKDLPLNEDSLKRLKALHELNAKSDRLNALKEITNKLVAAKVDSVRANVTEIENTRHADSICRTVNYLNNIPRRESLEIKISPLKINVSTPISVGNYQPYKPQYLDLSDIVENELIKDGLINKTNLKSSFVLSKSELIVNGEKQPQEIYERYKTKYVPNVGNNGWKLYRNYNARKNH